MAHVLDSAMQVQVRRSVPDQLSLPETQDAVKYAKVAKVSYDNNVDQVSEAHHCSLRCTLFVY
jgi:hypothetical protein